MPQYQVITSSDIVRRSNQVGLAKDRFSYAFFFDPRLHFVWDNFHFLIHIHFVAKKRRLGPKLLKETLRRLASSRGVLYWYCVLILDFIRLGLSCFSFYSNTMQEMFYPRPSTDFYMDSFSFQPPFDVTFFTTTEDSADGIMFSFRCPISDSASV
jgi:hypothetical protein